MKSIITLVIIFLSSSIIANAKSCDTINSLKKSGWVVHPSKKFDQLQNQFKLKLYNESSNLVPESQGVVYSSSASAMVKIVSLDNVKTPQSEMFGDYVMFSLHESGEYIEFRWYENGQKNLVYNDLVSLCPSAIIPMAENSLY